MVCVQLTLRDIGIVRDMAAYKAVLTSKRALTTENGLRIKPTPTRAVAPAMRLP